MQREQPGADGAEAEILVTDVLPGLLEEYAPDSSFIMLCDISCFEEVRRYMMTFTTAYRCQRRWSAAAPLPLNTFSVAAQIGRGIIKRGKALRGKHTPEDYAVDLWSLAATLLINTFSTGQWNVNNEGTEGDLTRVEDETDVHTCRIRALLLHVMLCRVGFTCLRSWSSLHFSVLSLANNVDMS